MAVADGVLALENAVFSVIAPEGAAAILFRDASRAPELARKMRITTADLVELGLVDVVIHEATAGVAESQLSMHVTSELRTLSDTRRSRRLAARNRRWRQIARPSAGRRRGR
jgi:acyl-CoA carboxylase subunit beta